MTNVLGLAAAILGDKFYWWIDPAGAIILAIYTITNWSGTVWENAGLMGHIHLAAASFLTYIYTVLSSLIELFLIAVSLIGQSAPPEMLQKLTYLVIRHHPRIKRVDTVRAYTFGVLYFVEVIWWCDLSR